MKKTNRARNVLPKMRYFCGVNVRHMVILVLIYRTLHHHGVPVWASMHSSIPIVQICSNTVPLSIQRIPIWIIWIMPSIRLPTNWAYQG